MRRMLVVIIASCAGMVSNAICACGVPRLWLTEDPSGTLKVHAESTVPVSGFSFGIRFVGAMEGLVIKEVKVGADVTAVGNPFYFLATIVENCQAFNLGVVVSSVPVGAVPPGADRELATIKFCGCVPVGAACTVTFVADVQGESPARLADDQAQSVTPCTEALLLAPGCRGVGFVRGDANIDGARDIADAIKILFHLFGGQALSCLDAADVNDDGQMNIADAVYALAFLFAAGAPPPPPFPDAGWDPTDDDLDCQTFPFGGECECDDEPSCTGSTRILLPGDVPLELVWCPEGSFMMGALEEEQDSQVWERPRHEVTIGRGFWLGKYELVQARLLRDLFVAHSWLR